MSATNPPGFPPYSTPPSNMPPGGTPLGAVSPSGPGASGAKPSAPTRRVVGLTRLLALGFAAVTLLAIGYITLTDEPPGLYVARSAMSLAEMTALGPQMIQIESIDARYVERDALTGDSVEQVEALIAGLYGQVTRYPINQGQQLRAELFTGAGGQLAQLTGTERLVSVPATVANAVGGSLRPGDRVDVIAVDRRQGVAGVIATNVEVVAVRLSADQLAGLSAEQIGPDGRDLRPEDLQPAQPIPGLYTLRIDAALATTLAVASSEGELHLVYRTVDALDVPGRAVALLEVLCLTTPTELRPLACLELPLPDADFLDALFGELSGELSGLFDDLGAGGTAGDAPATGQG